MVTEAKSMDVVARAFTGKRVLVTGAGGGIGREVCQLLDQVGARVTASDRSEEVLAGVPGRHLPFDVTDSEAVDATFQVAGQLDGLVLAHGITALSPLRELPAESIRRVIEVNLLGAAFCARAALPSLVSTHGRIAVLSSVSGYAPLVDRTAYSASKHGIHGFFDSLRAEVADDGVTVTIVAPSFVETGIEKRAAFRATGGSGDWSTTGEILQPREVALDVLVGMSQGRRLVLIGKTAKKAWLVSRLAPARYESMMRRRIRRGS